MNTNKTVKFLSVCFTVASLIGSLTWLKSPQESRLDLPGHMSVLLASLPEPPAEESYPRSPLITKPAEPPTQPPELARPRSTDLTVDNLEQAMQSSMAKVVPSLMQPVVDQLNILTDKYHKLEQRMIHVEQSQVLSRSEVTRMQAGLRNEMASIREAMARLSESLVEAKAKPQAPDQRLTKKIEELEKRLQNLLDKPAPRLEPKPETKSWNKRLTNFKLPCGYVISEIDIPEAGSYVQCPQCQKLTHVK